jgi:spoIIIJ-associated protein
MIKITSDTLEEAYQEACSKLQCSITKIKIEVVQYPRNIFGIIKKPAIVIASIKNNSSKELNIIIKKEKINKQKLDEDLENSILLDKKTVSIPVSDKRNTLSLNSVLNSFYQDKSDLDISQHSKPKNQDILDNIRKQINDVFLFDFIDFTLDEVSFYGDKTVYIKFVGKDIAVAIGKNGYRYKALSYLLFSWIHFEYNLFVKVELGEFLANQNKMIKKYLYKFIQEINTYGNGITEPLDGVLLHLGVEHLREIFPNKMVVIKSNKDKKRYIKVCDFK